MTVRRWLNLGRCEKDAALNVDTDIIEKFLPEF